MSRRQASAGGGSTWTGQPTTSQLITSRRVAPLPDRWILIAATLCLRAQAVNTGEDRAGGTSSFTKPVGSACDSPQSTGSEVGKLDRKHLQVQAFELGLIPFVPGLPMTGRDEAARNS